MTGQPPHPPPPALPPPPPPPRFPHAAAVSAADPHSPWSSGTLQRPGLPATRRTSTTFHDADAPAPPAGAHADDGGQRGHKGAHRATLAAGEVRVEVKRTGEGTADGGPASPHAGAPLASLEVHVTNAAGANVKHTVGPATLTPIGDAVVARGLIPHFESASRGKVVPGTEAYDLSARVDGHLCKATVVASVTSAGEELTVFPTGPLPAGSNGAVSGSRVSYRLVVPAVKLGGPSSRTGAAVVTAPMPGKVVKVMATSGASVTAGTPLLILEAMKMEHAIKAPVDGVVAAVKAAVGEFVADGAELVTFAAKPAAAASAAVAGKK
jgi:biotin carboxyl carrier protein